MKKGLMILLMCVLSLTGLFGHATDLQATLPAFKEYVLEMKEGWNIPAMAIGIVEGEEVIFMETFGTLSNQVQTPVDEHTTFQIGSTSKAFTATLMAMLVEDGNISWSEKVRDHYPQFQMADPWVSENMKLFDLMAQHSGMCPYVGDLAVILGFDADYILDKLKYMEPLYNFRKDFTYVNTLFLVCEKILEKEHNKSFEAILDEKIFDPLSMTDTSISYQKHLQRKNKTTTHTYAIKEPAAEKEIVVIPLNPLEPQFEWSYTYAPAGGIDSSISDMVKWLSFNMNSGTYNENRLISPKALDFLYTPSTLVDATKDGDFSAYCQGWIYQNFLTYPMIWHNGSTIGSKTMIAFIPKLNIGIVILTNVGGTTLPDNLAKDFFEARITGELGNRAQTDLVQTMNSLDDETVSEPEFISAPLDYSAYTGTYYNDVYGTVTVEYTGLELLMHLGPLDDPFYMVHINRDSFELVYNRCGIESLGIATFEINPYGKAESFSIDAFAEEGTGEFLRIVLP